MKKTNFNSPLNGWSDKSMRSALPVTLIRRAALLLIFFCLPLFCTGIKAQNLKREITFGLTDQPLKNGLDTLEKISGFRLSYILNQVTPYEHVTVKTATRTVEATLKLLLEKTNLIYELKGSNILIYEKQKEEGKTDGNVINVTGVVVDGSGYPLPGVNIVNKRAMTGTVPDNLGKFQINVLTGDTLMFSFIGYKTAEVRVTDQQPLNIRLEEDYTAIKEVVINAGYYTVKNQERTGSITTVTAREIENQPVSNVLSAMQGRMAGVNIVQSSGMPGGSYSVQIRGINSLRSEGNSPMYIIDGVPVNAEAPSCNSVMTYPDNGGISVLNTINPNDIESIEILKDADATAIYGSRGANGVILVTTRKGKAGQKTTFSVNGSYGLSRVASKMEMMNTEQYLEMRRQAYANDGITTYPANAYDINGRWDQTRYTDWQEELLGNTAVNATTQFSLSGGGENSGFILSGSHNEQTTVLGHDFRYKTNNLSGSMSYHSKDNRFMLNASGLFSAQSNNVIQSDVTTSVLKLCPDAPALYNEDGSVNWENNTFYDNPIASYVCSFSYKSNTFNTNINLQYELFKSFYVKLNGGIDYVALNDLVLYPSTQYNPAFGFTPSTNSMSLKSQNQRLSYLLEPQLNYKHTFGEHQIEILAGGTYQQTQAVALNVCGYGFTSNALITNVAAANNIYVYDDNPTNYKYAAIFGRINYQYKNRYFVNFTGRRDGSSRFGPDNRYANFGAIGAAWLFSKESFLSDTKWLSFGKLRASYGLTGSDLIGDYQYLDTYTASSSMYGGNTTMYPSKLYNPYFSWEKTSKLEIALETGFLDDRVRFTAALYRNRSGNQLVGIPLPATTGFSNIQANLPAIVENKGLEMELNATPVRTENFSWNSDLNISFPRNKLVAFPGLEGSTYANTYVIGYPVTIAKVYNYTGIDQATGYYTFTDYNEDGSISTPDDNLVIEDIGIKYFGGWTNEVSFRNWTFSFLLQFVSQKQWNYLSQGTGNPGTKFNKPVEFLDVWSEDNPDGRFMPYTTGAISGKNKVLGYFRTSTAAISDASYIRLKNIQLSYRLPVNGYVNDILVYVQGQNLLTLTDYFGLDPEFVEIGYLPPLKTWSFGVQLSF